MTNKITGRLLAANRSRNRYIVAAIALTTLLIASVFSIGMSYIKSNEMQQIRLMGTTAHVAVTNPIDEQVEKLHELSYVETVGLQRNVGLIKNTPQMGNMTLSLHWYDQTEWQEFRKPAVVDMVGIYPEKYNEVLVPLWILHNMGIDDPQIGMEIPLDYYLGEDREVVQTTNFILSGYCTDYVHIRSGNIDSIYVSEQFAASSGNTVQNNGAASVAYCDSKDIDGYNQQLADDLQLTADQKIKTVPMYDSSDSQSLYYMLAFAAVIFFLMLTGYLLIYNVFYISVAKDTRFWGLLKAIGATPRQLIRIVTGQALLLAAIGIPLGLAVSAVLSFAVVPMALNMFDLATGAEISFSPLIFIGAAFFALLTTMIGAAKSARTAAKISPLAALRYTGVATAKNTKRSTSGADLSKMAWRNIFRDRKRALIVLLSLFLGITTFMVVTTLVSSMDTDNYIASYVDNDIILENNTLDTVGTENTPQQKFDDVFMAELNNIDGVTNLRTTTMEKMQMVYDPTQFSDHIDWFCNMFGVEDEDKPTEQQIRDNFWGYIIGIDSRYIEEMNENSDNPIDVEAFKRGEIALIGTNNPKLYDNVDQLDITVSSSGVVAQFALGGFVPYLFQYAGGCMAPNIYVSEQTLAKLVADPKIYKVNMDVEDDLEQQALEQVKKLTDDDYDISRTSKLEQQQAMSDTKMLLYILGGGIALVLALIGILNFINVMATGVMARRLEFAMLESVGMTKRQLQRMLMLEGLGYAVITTLLVGTLGSAVTYLIFRLFQQQADYAIFTFPVIPMLIAMVIVLIVCMVAPKMSYRSGSSASIVERLRQTE